MIEIKLRVGDVDYDSLAELLLPAVFEQMGQGADSPLWSRLLFSSQGLTEAAAKAVLKKLSRDKKEEILVKYINKNGSVFAEAFKQMAYDRGIRLAVEKVEARKE
jgi:hypothetical protein